MFHFIQQRQLFKGIFIFNLKKLLFKKLIHVYCSNHAYLFSLIVRNLTTIWVKETVVEVQTDV